MPIRPGYKARDVDFASSLAGALKKTGGSDRRPGRVEQLDARDDAAGRRDERHVDGGDRSRATWPARRRSPRRAARPTTTAICNTGCRSQPALDGNTVDIDTERVQFADNTLHFESGMTVLSSQIKTMLSAITSGS